MGSTPSFVRVLEPKARMADGSEVVPSAVTDMWVYANDEAIGVWQENRSAIPVLSEGSTYIKIVAGVRRNGITQDRIQYPFYATWSQNVDLTLGQGGHGSAGVQVVCRAHLEEGFSLGLPVRFQRFRLGHGIRHRSGRRDPG